MKVRITLKDIPAYKQEFLEADYHFFQADLKYQLCEAIEKLTGNRSLSASLLRAMRRINPTAGLTLDSLVSQLEVLKEYKVFSYRIIHEGRNSIVYLDMSEDYFNIVNLIRHYNPLLPIGLTKDGFIKKSEKEIKKTYTDKMRIERLD